MVRGTLSRVISRVGRSWQQQQQHHRHQQIRHLNVHEYQGSSLMRKYGVNIPKGVVVSSVSEVKQAINDTFPGEEEVVIKSQVSGMEIFGATMYTCIVWTVNCQIALALSYFTWLHHLFIWGSVTFWYFFLFVYGSIKPTVSTTAYKVFVEACGPSPMYWFLTLVVVISALVPYFTYSAFQRRFFSFVSWHHSMGKA